MSSNIIDEDYPDVEYISEYVGTSENNKGNNCATFCNRCYKALFFNSTDFVSHPEYQSMWKLQLCTYHYNLLRQVNEPTPSN